MKLLLRSLILSERKRMEIYNNFLVKNDIKSRKQQILNDLEGKR